MQAAYIIGGHSISAADIEYNILKMKPPAHRPQIVRHMCNSPSIPCEIHPVPHTSSGQGLLLIDPIFFFRCSRIDYSVGPCFQ
jgi:hypothetical protein